MRLWVYVLILAFLATAVSARQGHMTLLAVQQTETGNIGATADLYLEIQSGRGRVFLDTFPLTKIDTQISTRFARDIACDYLDLDCTNYDFFYTIRADSHIIGGPSAGAATAALTAALLENHETDGSIAITGTINSGGLVGPVGGLAAKIRAAARHEDTVKVLVPKGERFVKEDNKTIDLVEVGKGLGIEVVEVANLNDALYHFTGKHLREQKQSLSIDPDYLKTMEFLAGDLCTRAETLHMEVEQRAELTAKLSDEYTSKIESAQNLTERSIKAIEEGLYYAAASYCFGANVNYQRIIQELQQRSLSDLQRAIAAVDENISQMVDELRQTEPSTITDLQAFIVVSERLGEAREQIELAKTVNESQEAHLAYAIERVQSARSWSTFFGQPGKQFVLDEEVLRVSCLSKIAEAEQSYQYVNVFFPGLLEKTSDEINQAYRFSDSRDYALCLAKASSAKANANAVLGVIGVAESQIDTVITEKLEAGKQSIIEQADEGAFPILGYSYWEYASSLREYDKYSALLYAEYALELSNMDIYFENRRQRFFIDIDPVMFWIFGLGLSVGFLLGWRLKRHGQLKPKRKSTKSRKK